MRVEVDDKAWAAVKREAVHRRLWLVWWIGNMVRIEVDAIAAREVTGTPSSRRRRSPGESAPRTRRRFARIDIDDEHWIALRTVALDAGLTVGRYVGEIVEAAAYEAGWRTAPSVRE